MSQCDVLWNIKLVKVPLDYIIKETQRKGIEGAEQEIGRIRTPLPYFFEPKKPSVVP